MVVNGVEGRVALHMMIVRLLRREGIRKRDVVIQCSVAVGMTRRVLGGPVFG